MTGLFLVSLVAAQAAPIGSTLSEGIELVYESRGVVQTPWVYDSVRLVGRGDFDRCIVAQRRSEPARESCVRADTLFERTESDTYRAVRPIGPNMQLEVRSASGDVLRYTTGEVEIRRLADGLEVATLPTSIVTHDRSGAVTRRLREHYAPSLLTAVSGVFEEPNESGGWRSVLEFSLIEVRRHESYLDEMVKPLSPLIRETAEWLRALLLSEFPQLFIHDPEHLPQTELEREGKGKHMRHIKLDSIPESRRATIVELARIPVARRS